MLEDCKKYADAVNAKGEPFPTESLLMAVMLSQHVLIGRLLEMVKPAEQHVSTGSSSFAWQEHSAS